MAFCKKCGHNNPGGGVFCENCGTPVVENPTPSQSAAPGRPGNSKIWILGGVAVVGVIAIIGAGAVLFLGSDGASEASFASAVQKHLEENKAFVEGKTCLTNFAYDKDPVAVSQRDAQTQKWMSVLVEGGLYEKPEEGSSGGYSPSPQWVYKKTNTGRKATQGRKLCFAEGLTVKKIEDMVKPEKIGNTTVSRASALLDYKNPMPWTQSAQAKDIVPERFSNAMRESVSFILNKEGKWVVASPAQIAAIRSESRTAQPRQSADSQQSGGFFAGIANLFSGFGGNPLIGKWQMETMGITATVFEFTSNSMRSANGIGIAKVRYEVKDKEVSVIPEGQRDVSLTFKVIDADTISMGTGLEIMKLTRVK